MLDALSAIAKQTALICNTCRTASEKSDSPSTKRNFVQLAKDIANGTATVVQAVKVLTGHCSVLPVATQTHHTIQDGRLLELFCAVLSAAIMHRLGFHVRFNCVSIVVACTNC